MAVHKEDKAIRRKKWTTPELTSIEGLDSCVEFLYGDNGTPGGNERPRHQDPNTNVTG